MKITKIGHCCLLVEEQGKVIMTDPGVFSDQQNSVTGVDLILITHEHQDHLHVESLQAVLQNNPEAQVITNSAVGKLLDEAKIAYTLLEDGGKQTWEGINLAGFGKDHAVIYHTVPVVMNTGYMIADRFFYPGDAFTSPQQPVEIVAMPLAGPWMKISESLDWVQQLKPKVCFPVHDAILSETARPWMSKMPEYILKESGITFEVIEPGESRDYG